MPYSTPLDKPRREMDEKRIKLATERSQGNRDRGYGQRDDVDRSQRIKNLQVVVVCVSAVSSSGEGMGHEYNNLSLRYIGKAPKRDGTTNSSE